MPCEDCGDQDVSYDSLMEEWFCIECEKKVDVE